jgi:hypothetical protein
MVTAVHKARRTMVFEKNREKLERTAIFKFERFFDRVELKKNKKVFPFEKARVFKLTKDICTLQNQQNKASPGRAHISSKHFGACRS